MRNSTNKNENEIKGKRIIRKKWWKCGNGAIEIESEEQSDCEEKEEEEEADQKMEGTTCPGCLAMTMREREIYA